MAECSSSFIAPHSEKEENTKLINGCIAKGVWENITSSKEYKKVESKELEELEAYLADDPSFFPKGWLDKEPSPPKKKLKLSLSYCMHTRGHLQNSRRPLVKVSTLESFLT